MKFLATLALVIGLAAFTGCQAIDNVTGKQEACAVTALGQTLCGSELQAWCDKFANRSDFDTDEACRQVD